MNILTLSTYPFGMPRHGGQHRLSNIVAAYEATGHQVRSVGVLGSAIYPSEPGFLPVPSGEQLSAYISNSFMMEDWAIGRLAAEDDDYFERLASLIMEAPDLIHVEQPWLYAFARRYNQCRGARSVIFYGSQNVEHALKRTIVSGYLGDEHAEACEKLVLACEREASAGADLACAVSEEDAHWLAQNGASDVVVAANGVRAELVSHEGIKQANRISGHRKYALYCASGHPPNVVGFYDMFGQGVGCLSPEDRLVVVGSAGQAIRADARFLSVPGLARHYVDSGEIDQETLQGLIHCAHVIALPITQGGGTNLKTAEALWSGHHVVATRKAMRGFEPFVDDDAVSVCDDDVAFRQALRGRMTSQPMRLDSTQVAQRQSVLWSSTLRPLVTRLSSTERYLHG